MSESCSECGAPPGYSLLLEKKIELIEGLCNTCLMIKHGVSYDLRDDLQRHLDDVVREER